MCWKGKHSTKTLVKSFVAVHACESWNNLGGRGNLRDFYMLKKIQGIVAQFWIPFRIDSCKKEEIERGKAGPPESPWQALCLVFRSKRRNVCVSILSMGIFVLYLVAGF